MKRIAAEHLAGEGGRAKVEGWVPRWMAFPPSAYTARGGVGAVMAHYTRVQGLTDFPTEAKAVAKAARDVGIRVIGLDNQNFLSLRYDLLDLFGICHDAIVLGRWGFKKFGVLPEP